MLTLSTLVAGCLTILVLLPPPPVAAQDSFGDLSDKVRKGQTIIVVDPQGAVTEGRIEDLDGSRLVVNYFRGRIQDPSLNTTRTFTPENVWRVQKPAHLWDGAIKGAAVGLIPAVFALGAECNGCRLGGFAVFCVTVGAAAGVGIDALSGPKTIYRREAVRPSKITVIPMLGKERRGLAASIRF